MDGCRAGRLRQDNILANGRNLIAAMQLPSALTATTGVGAAFAKRL